MLITLKSDIRAPTAPVLGTPTAVSSSSLSVPMTTVATDVGGVASYSLERATSAAGTYTVISSAATFPYSDTGLTASTTYYYRARATDSSGNVGTYSAIVSGTTSSASSSVITLFDFDPTTPGAAFAYNTAGKRGFTGTANGGNDGQVNWSGDHMPTGGYDGGPCAHAVHKAGRWQTYMGWDLPAMSGWSPTLGWSICFAFRIRFDDANRFDHGSNNKFIDFSSGSSRVIVWYCVPYVEGGGGGTLGWPGAEGGPSHAIPSVYGISGAWASGANVDQYGGICASRGVGFKSSEPALISYGNKSPAPRPGPSGAGAAPVNGWYHVQVIATSGNDNGGSAPISRFRIWVNNNNYNNPTADQFSWNAGAEPGGLTASGWANASCLVGGYTGDEPGQSGDFGYRLQRMRLRGAANAQDTFDPAWYPG